MNKLQPSINQGIEYIRISELPLGQHRPFVKWIAPTSIFEVEEKGVLHHDCVSYGEYEFWVETHYNHYFTQERILF